MLRDQALLLEDVQSQALLHWAQVWVRDPASFCPKEKTKQLLGLSEQAMVKQPGALGAPLIPAASPQPRHASDPHVSLSVENTVLPTGSRLKIQIPQCHHFYQASSVKLFFVFSTNSNPARPPKPSQLGASATSTPWSGLVLFSGSCKLFY